MCIPVAYTIKQQRNVYTAKTLAQVWELQSPL